MCVETFNAHFTHMVKLAPRDTTTAPSPCSSAHAQQRIFLLLFFCFVFFFWMRCDALVYAAVCARDGQRGGYDQDDENQNHEPDDEAVAVHLKVCFYFLFLFLFFF
jgi:hypothetical protein